MDTPFSVDLYKTQDILDIQPAKHQKIIRSSMWHKNATECTDSN